MLTSTSYKQGSKSPLEYAEEVAAEADKYNGFNLVLADLNSKTMLYVSNRPKGKPASIKLVSPGLHVLSNAGLDSPWHKVCSHHKKLFWKIQLSSIFLNLVRERTAGKKPPFTHKNQLEEELVSSFL